MCILKKLLNHLKEKTPKEQECWYNNYHEKRRKSWETPSESDALCSPNQVYYTTAQQAAKHSW